MGLLYPYETIYKLKINCKMGLPNVKINITNGALGTVDAKNGGVAAMILRGTTKGGEDVQPDPVSTPIVLNSLNDAVKNNITPEYDSERGVNAYHHIKEFYDEAGEGAKLWVMVVDKSVEMNNLVSAQHPEFAKKLIDAGQGEIRLLGLTGAVVETPTITKGLQTDVANAINGAQTFVGNYVEKIAPFITVLEGKNWDKSATDIENLREGDDNRVSVALCSSKTDGSASIGLVLGRLAKVEEQTRISRVKDGSLSINKAYFSNGEIVDNATAESLHDKGYVVMRTFPRTNGYFFASDYTATKASDDLNRISLVRTIDKALMIAYDTYINSVDDEIEMDSKGQVLASVAKSLETDIEDMVRIQMNGQISSFDAFIDPAQNIISTGQLSVVCKIVPKGYLNEIVVDLGFSNPALSN
jgi:hypothetical protein